MLRLPVKNRILSNCSTSWRCLHSSSSHIRNAFIEYFTETQGHKYVKSSSVVPLFDATVPFVNSGMNQFKGVFLGKHSAPCSKAVNSQKCVRVGGKHNDLDAVGLDGHHHTFFEMLGNWSFGDYYKKEACQMAWELLLGPYQLKPENILVTYFGGHVALNLQEDRECRDIWKSIGVQTDRIKAMDANETFWEMGATGPCGPCTEIHHVNPDGSVTEIWNIVFIQYNREVDGSIKPLNSHHVDTGMGLERMAALLQGVPTNYDTDLFRPIIDAIQRKCKAPSYTGSFDSSAHLDIAYRKLADHARMMSVCLSDGSFPASSLNLKQIMRKSIKISQDVFNCKYGMLSELYDHVADSLGPVYPELVSKQRDAKKIIEYEERAYDKMRSSLTKKWKELVKQYPEVESLQDVELSGFTQGYTEFKQTMAANKSSTIPGDVIFKLYDTHGFQKDIIEKIATINNLNMDKDGFENMLKKHKSRHKTAFKEQTNKNMALCLQQAVSKLTENGIRNTNDEYKYKYSSKGDDIVFKPLKSKLVAILNDDGVWLDVLETNTKHKYYLITETTNFYCEEGGQAPDLGMIKISENLDFNVETVFKIRDYVFHKGSFKINDKNGDKYVRLGEEVMLEIDGIRRLNIMRNHTAIHLLNAAIRKVLPDSVVCQVGSKVTDENLMLNLSVYGDKLTQKIVVEAQELVRKVIAANKPVKTSVVDSMQVSQIEDVVTVPGEVYPETGLRLVEIRTEDLLSRELCCGTHLSRTGDVKEFSVSLVRAAGSQAPQIHALAGENAVKLRELSDRARALNKLFKSLDPVEVKKDMAEIKERLSTVCGSGGAAYGEYGTCVELLDQLKRKSSQDDDQKNDMALQAVAESEMAELAQEAVKQGRRFIVHFLRCSYLMESACVTAALRPCVNTPALVLGCANSYINAACFVPKSYVTKDFTAEKWMGCILPVFQSELAPCVAGQTLEAYASMTAAKVSLINCEMLVQDAMRAAIRYAGAHTKDKQETDRPTQDRRHN